MEERERGWMRRSADLTEWCGTWSVEVGWRRGIDFPDLCLVPETFPVGLLVP